MKKTEKTSKAFLNNACARSSHVSAPQPAKTSQLAAGAFRSCPRCGAFVDRAHDGACPHCGYEWEPSTSTTVDKTRTVYIIKFIRGPHCGDYLHSFKPYMWTFDVSNRWDAACVFGSNIEALCVAFCTMIDRDVEVLLIEPHPEL